MPSDAGMYSNLVLSLCGDSGQDEESLYRVHCDWAERYEYPHVATGIGFTVWDPGRTLRIGSLSPDFANHSVAYFVEGVLANHDHRRFHVTCYADGLTNDDMTARLRSTADNWHPTAGLIDTALLAQICDDRIDVLIDLAGHTANNRQPLFARRAA